MTANLFESITWRCHFSVEVGRQTPESAFRCIWNNLVQALSTELRLLLIGRDAEAITMIGRHSNQAYPWGRWSTRSLLVVVSAALLNSGAVLATTCVPNYSTLQEDYELADAIVLAQASSCAQGEPVGGWNCEDRLFNLDVIEVIKDSVPSRDYGGAYAGADLAWGCGLGYQLGETYLIFFDGKGGYSTGSARVSGDDMGVFLAEQRLDVLRQYRDGSVADLSGPWWFMDTGVSCSVSHRFAGGGISVGLGYGDYKGRVAGMPRRGPDGELQFDVQPMPPGTQPLLEQTTTGPVYDPGDVVLSVSLKDAADLVPASVSIKVDGRAWPLWQRTTTMRAGVSDQKIYSFATAGNPALEILDAMSRPSAVVVTVARGGDSGGIEAATDGATAGTPMLTSFKTRSTQFANTSAKLKACIDGTARRGVSSLSP